MTPPDLEGLAPLKSCVVLQSPRGRVCRSVPGGLCGGVDDVYGVCGEGLSCSPCNKCVGCSYNSFTCYEEELECYYWVGLETAININSVILT